MADPTIPGRRRGAASHTRRWKRRGVGLIEVAIALVIVAVGAVAVMQFMAAASTTNGRLGDLTTGMRLASSALEYATSQDYATVEGWLTKAPVFPDTGRNYLANGTDVDLAKQGWKQAFAAQRIQLANLQKSSTNSDDTCVRVTVTVSKGGKPVYTASRWFTKAP